MKEIRIKDFSSLSENEAAAKVLINEDYNSDEIYIPTYFDFQQKPTICNLGLYYNLKDNTIRADRFVGIVPLQSRSGKIINNDYYISVAPRWGNAVSMLEYVLNSEQITDEKISNFIEPKIKTYEEWKKTDLVSKNSDVLYGIISDLPEVELSADNKGMEGFDTSIVPDIQNVFEVAQFLKCVQDICRKNLKQQSLPRECNLVGKVKGRIDVSKQIKKNLAKGRKDRNYCIYNSMSIDNQENRILKYALHLCKMWAFSKGELFSEQIFYCENVFKSVRLVKVTKSEIMGIKCNSAYKDYKMAIGLAARIIDKMDISFNANGEEQVKVKKATPFFIRMDLLFELYCRALVEKAIEKSGKQLKLREYSDNATEIFVQNGEKNPVGFQNENIADLVIESTDVNKQMNIVIDAKYIFLEDGSIGIRERTHQLLAYMLLYDAKVCGFIYPFEQRTENPEIKRKQMLVGDRWGVSIPLSTKCDVDIEKMSVLLKELFE